MKKIKDKVCAAPECFILFTPWNSLTKACSPECALELVRAKNAARAKREVKAKQKADRAEHRESKKSVKPRKYWFDKLQKLVNQYVTHIRDKDKPCCTCGAVDPALKYDAGHFITRAAGPEVRFELTNIHRQCSIRCNVHGSGMRLEYEKFIIANYGQDHLDWLTGPHKLLKDQFPHYTDIEKEIIRYRKIIKEAGLKPSA